MHKSQASHHRHQHHLNPNSTTRPPIQNSQISPHHQAYLLHSHHHSPVDTVSPQRQQQQTNYPQQQRISSHHNNTKESISIQEFINKNVNDFVSLTSKKKTKVIMTFIGMKIVFYINQGYFMPTRV
jgi:hypothetical protein